jgi:hypothetical protein
LCQLVSMCHVICARFYEHIRMSCVSLCLYATSFVHCFVNRLGCLVSACACVCLVICALFCEQVGMSCVCLCPYEAAFVIVHVSCSFTWFPSDPTLTSFHYLLACIAMGILQCIFLCVLCSYVLRMKEFERERRLLQRKKRIEARAQREEILAA